MMNHGRPDDFATTAATDPCEIWLLDGGTGEKKDKSHDRCVRTLKNMPQLYYCPRTRRWKRCEESKQNMSSDSFAVREKSERLSCHFARSKALRKAPAAKKKKSSGGNWKRKKIGSGFVHGVFCFTNRTKLA